MSGRGGRFDRRRPEQGLRINHRIRIPEVRVIGADNEAIGIVSTQEALRMAEEKGLDLVEISPRAFPPVCKIMDYGKYKYEEAKKKQQAKKRASTVETKEIKFRPKTEGHDLAFKVKHIRRFMLDGNKVRLVVVFRGREITHPQTGANMLNRVVEATADIATVEASPNMEGRRMLMVVAPTTTIDWTMPSGDLIEIEQRNQSELLPTCYNNQDSLVSAWNPVFDVTPAELIAAIVTECGVVLNPFEQGVRGLKNAI